MSRATRVGVTLVEMIIVLTLAGVLLSIALPRTAAARTQYTLQAAAVQFHGDLVRARLEAVRRNSAVTVSKVSSAEYTVQYIGARALPGGVTFESSAADQYVFPPFGPSTSGARSFDLQLRGHSRTVTISTSGMAGIR